MRIAIHSQGEWNDAEVTPETLQAMLAAGEMGFRSGYTHTGNAFGESPALPIYYADQWPGWPVGFDYIPNALDHGFSL